jgi:hypothetical protein
VTSVADRSDSRIDMGSVRFWVAADAAITGANALIYLAAAPVIVDLMGSQTSDVRAIGGFLLAFAALVALVAAPTATPRFGVRVIIAVNAVWVLASLAVAVGGGLGLTALGTVWVVAQAGVVGVLAVQQYRTR